MSRLRQLEFALNLVEQEIEVYQQKLIDKVNLKDCLIMALEDIK